MHKQISVLIVLCCTLLLASGCSKTEETVPESQVPATQSEVEAFETPSRPLVIIPPEVQGQWKAVQISVHDRERHLDEEFTVDIGSGFSFGDGQLYLEVVTFLPHFVMQGLIMTSSSNRPENPGVQIILSENGEEIYSGWLFSLYPDAHAFQHPRYVFTLVDFIPVESADDN